MAVISGSVHGNKIFLNDSKGFFLPQQPRGSSPAPSQARPAPCQQPTASLGGGDLRGGPCPSAARGELELAFSHPQEDFQLPSAQPGASQDRALAPWGCPVGAAGFPRQRVTPQALFDPLHPVLGAGTKHREKNSVQFAQLPVVLFISARFQIQIAVRHSTEQPGRERESPFLPSSSPERPEVPPSRSPPGPHLSLPAHLSRL